MHSPGTWWADDRNHIHNDPVGSVKVAKVDGANWQQAKDNARLIAAAPDLLTMLERVVDAEFGFGGWPSEAEIRQVIEKAKGKTC